ncbi:hypothetical protein [Rathayibacter sp. SD072]|uniref:hypothetical protein n=1 Tax=Rathayibacter sp. SD072 TaxID=2781731 RepID=UPI001A95CAAE|nr:hypothetical protein [Rathayibacter sp. SD072]
MPILAADVAPTQRILPGTEVIDGVPFVFDAVSGAETADQLVIRLPEQGILVAQDLVYHGTHVFVGHNDIARWQEILLSCADPSYETILPGHGLPAGQEVLKQMQAYLAVASDVLGTDGEAYKRTMLERFPELGAPFVIDIGNCYLFGARPILE